VIASKDVIKQKAPIVLNIGNTNCGLSNKKINKIAVMGIKLVRFIIKNN
jgi:hypothetical protein